MFKRFENLTLVEYFIIDLNWKLKLESSGWVSGGGFWGYVPMCLNPGFHCTVHTYTASVVNIWNSCGFHVSETNSLPGNHAHIVTPGPPTKWHPFQLSTAKHQIFIQFGQFWHLLLIIHNIKCAHLGLFENIFTNLSEHLCFSARKLRIKQRSSLVNPTIVTKLQFIHMQTELAYIGRQRTTSFNANGVWVGQIKSVNIHN